jgi:hypothetical protein
MGVRNSCEVTEMKRLFIAEIWCSFSSMAVISASNRLRAVTSRTKTTYSSRLMGAVRSSTATGLADVASSCSATTEAFAARVFSPTVRIRVRNDSAVPRRPSVTSDSLRPASGVSPLAGW